MMHERFHPVADRLHGSLVTPDDSEYDRARGAWNLMYSHRPSLTRHAGGAISRPPGETAYTTRGQTGCSRSWH